MQGILRQRSRIRRAPNYGARTTSPAVVKRLQAWIAAPSIAAENLGFPARTEYMASLAREAGFQTVRIMNTIRPCGGARTSQHGESPPVVDRGTIVPVTAEQLWDTLMRFHHEVALPSIVDPLRREFRAGIRELRDDMNSHFDAIYDRLDRLESEYQAVSAALTRLEARMTSVEEKLDRMALQSQLNELERRVATLEEELEEIRSEL